MMIEEVEKELQALGNPKQAILCGIEAHACIAVRPNYNCAVYQFKLHYIPHSIQRGTLTLASYDFECLTLVNMFSAYYIILISFPQCTTYDLLEKGMEVHIVADAVSSRRYFFCLLFFFFLLLPVVFSCNK